MKKIFELNNLNVIDNIFWGKTNGPAYVYIEITRKCNCKCEYCQILNMDNSDIDLELYQRILKQLRDLNCFEIRLGGGEPLLNSKLNEILQLSEGFSIWLCTNGIMLTRDVCELLKKHNVLGVRVSLDSLNSELHNKIRKNPFAFQNATKNMKLAKEVGLEVCLSMTIGHHNIDEVENMKKFAKENGYKFLTHFVMPVGNGESFIKQEEISEEKRISLLSDESGERNCVAGNQSFAIDILGNVSACTFLKPIANIKEVDLKDIVYIKFDKYLKAIPNSKLCEKCKLKKTMNDGRCMACEICRGGCWALYER